MNLLFAITPPSADPWGGLHTLATELPINPAIG